MQTVNVSRETEWLGAWVGRELMMMSADRGTYVSLSESGGRIWELLEQEHTVEKICERLADEYDVSASEVEQEVRLFIEQLAQERVLHVHAETIT